jgi:hypothetical protein
LRKTRKTIDEFKDLNFSINDNTPPNNQNQPTNTISSDSITEVHFLGEPRKSVSFKCNEKLWKSFVFEIKAQGLSVCHILEPMIYGWLEGKVHLSNTIRPLKIENLVVERAVKRVRRYAVEEEEEPKDVCFYCLPRRVRAVGLFRYVKTGEVFALCQSHAKELVGSGLWTCA